MQHDVHHCHDRSQMLEVVSKWSTTIEIMRFDS